MAQLTDEAAAPTYLGMVMCDNLLRDPETRKHYLLGTTTQTFARAFPARYQKMCIYAVLTGIREQTEVSVKLVRWDDEQSEDVQLMEIKGKVEAPDPLAVAELTLCFRNLVFPVPGEYRFQLWSRSVVLGERKFIVNQIQQSPPGGDQTGPHTV